MVNQTQVPPEQPIPTARKLQWREYEVQVDLYKHYMDMLMKVNAFFYIITGGVLSFYFLNYGKPFVRYALLFPILISCVLGAMFFYGASKWGRVVKLIRGAIDTLDLVKAPDIQVLYFLLSASGIVFLGVGVSMFVLFLYPLR
jgi:hypothetical protein